MPMDHDFWLFRQGERAYTDYDDLLPRRDAPVSIDDEVLRYMLDTIKCKFSVSLDVFIVRRRNLPMVRASASPRHGAAV
jgi:hypothetical protein